jgi:hypothetical protein
VTVVLELVVMALELHEAADQQHVLPTAMMPLDVKCPSTHVTCPLGDDKVKTAAAAGSSASCCSCTQLFGAFRQFIPPHTSCYGTTACRPQQQGSHSPP